MYSRNIIDEDSYETLKKVIDGYYGIRILAVNYNVNADFVKETTGRAFDRIWEMAERCLPVQDTLCFKHNHYSSTYYAWMMNYDPSTGNIINN